MRVQIKEADEKLDRLMHAYLDKVLSLDEYRQAKNKLIDEKQEFKEQLTPMWNKTEETGSNRPFGS